MGLNLRKLYSGDLKGFYSIKKCACVKVEHDMAIDNSHMTHYLIKKYREGYYLSVGLIIECRGHLGILIKMEMRLIGAIHY